MEKETKAPRYTEEDIKKILNLRKAGKSQRQIAIELGRSNGSVANILWAYDHFNRIYNLDGREQAPKAKMTYRDMIKALYDAGYRIEDNQVVCYVRQVVKIGDIVNG